MKDVGGIWQKIAGGIRSPGLGEFGVRTVTAVRRLADAIEWIALRQRKDAVEIVDRRTVPAPVAGTEDAPAPDPVETLKIAMAGARGGVTLVVPAGQALMRVVDLPSTDPVELGGMAELQVDRFSPFPVEHMVVSHEVFAQKDGVSRVLLAALPRTLVDAESEAFGTAGFELERIDLDLLGWWRNLRAANRTDAPGRVVHLLLESGAATMLVAQDGMPLLCSSLGRGPNAQEASDLGELVEELNFTLTTLEADWGASETRMTVWAPGAAPAGVAASLATGCGVPAEAASLDELPVAIEGASRRTLAAEGGTLDLAPAEWAEARRNRRAAKRVMYAAAGCIAVWLVVVVGFLVALRVREMSNGRLKIAVETLEKPAAEVRALQTRVRVLEEYADRSHSALELLREVSAVLPESVTLSSMTVKKGKSVSLRGDAPAANAIYDFFSALEKSTLFVKVLPEGVTSKSSMGRNRSEFRWSATLPGEEATP